MAFTYLIMNIFFLVCIFVIFLQYFVKPTKSVWIALGILLVLTALFDSIIIGAGIVAYDTDKILGLYVGLAPVEDFFYAILAIAIVPALWNLFEPKKEKRDK
jgi:lycopene cyclase domain-containing protein